MHSESNSRFSSVVQCRAHFGVQSFLEGGLATYALFFLVGIACYFPSFSRQLVWDDIYLLGSNPFIRSPFLLPSIFTHGLWGVSSSYYRPVQNVTYMLEYCITPDFALLAHVSNVAIHALAATLLLRLLRRLTFAVGNLKGDSWEARGVFAIAVVWLVHPMHNAAVAYLSGRADPLAAVFSMVAWLAVLRSGEGRSKSASAVWAGVAFVAFLIALCSKEIAITWLGFFVIHGCCTAGWRNRRFALVLLGAAGAIGCWWILRQIPAAQAIPVEKASTPLWYRLLLVCAAAGDYLQVLLLPIRLTMERRVTTLSVQDGLSAWLDGSNLLLPAIGLLLFAALAAGIISKRPGAVLRRIGAACFVLGFLPISNLFPLMAQVAEHWIYHSSIGLLLFGAGVVIGLPRRWQRAIWALFAVWCVALAGRTYLRSFDWSSHERLVTATLKAGGDSAKMLGVRAVMLGDQGKWLEQEQVLREILRRKSETISARVGLARNLEAQGKSRESDAIYEALAAELGTVKMAGDEWFGPLHVALWMERRQRVPEAISLLESTLRRVPTSWEITDLLARMRNKSGDGPGAEQLIDRYAQANRWDLQAQLRRADYRIHSGRFEEALQILSEADRLDIHGSLVPSRRALVEFLAGKNNAATEWLTEAFVRNPDSIAAREVAVFILQEQGKTVEAERFRNEMREIASRPGNRRNGLAAR